MLTESPFTIAVATIQGWPDISLNVRSYEAAAAAVGGDVIIADGSGKPEPTRAALGPRTQWMSIPGESVFQLRLRAYRLAAGEIIGITEDHCHVPPDWGELMLRAHAENPGVAAVGGSVLNGATGTLVDWAGFLVVQAAFVAPISSGPVARLNGAVNVAYKRRAVDAMSDFGGLGALDGLHQGDLLARGESLVADDRVRVVHDQHFNFRDMTTIHFHAGRTISAFRRERMDMRQFARLVGSFVVPVARYARLVALCAPRGHGLRIALGTPLILWLLYVQAAGQFVGYVFGPGDSPRQLQ